MKNPNGIAVVQALLDHGAGINTPNDIGMTPLIEAAGGSHTDIVRLLIRRGADVNARCASGHSALTAGSDPATIQILQQAGATGRSGVIQTNK